MGLELELRFKQKVKIGDDITVEVIQQRSGRLRVYIQAPRHIKIDRLPPPVEGQERDKNGNNLPPALRIPERTRPDLPAGLQ